MYRLMYAGISFFLLAQLGLARADYNGDIKICNTPAVNPETAIGACTRLLNNPRQGVKIPLTFQLRGIAKLVIGDNDGAIADFTTQLNLHPDKFGYSLRGGAWADKGNFDNALADANKAIRLDSKFSQGYVNRANIYIDLRDWDKALSDLDEVANDPKSKEYYLLNRGEVFSRSGQYDRAIAEYDKLIKLNPNHTSVFANKGRAWLMKGDLERALSDVNKQLQIKKDSALALVFRGDVYRYLGQYNPALADYGTALKIKSDWIPAYVGRGLTFEKMGDLTRARSEFQNALDSKSPQKGNESSLGLETARSRIAAIDSGSPQPQFASSQTNTSKFNSIPTPEVLPSESIKATATDNRIALVIGNSSYTGVPALANPQKDANAIAETFNKLGFKTVALSTDLSRDKMVDALRSFANQAEQADWAVVYYAGHGMEVAGVNYLIPVDAKLAVDRDIQFEAIPLAQVLSAAGAAKKIKLIVLDACRDNPFKPRKTDAPEQLAQLGSTAGAPVASRSTNGRGLAEVKVTGATLVVYAAKDGQVALDGEGGNSPFAVAMVQRLGTPGVEINKIFRLVRDDVMEATAGRQEPYTYGSLPGKEDFFFVTK